MKIKFFVIFFSLFVALSAFAGDTGIVAISHGDKFVTNVKVEIADTDALRAKGLMFRKSLPMDSGMWFVFDGEVVTPFWMKNTYLSLDIIFVDNDNRIISMKKEADPLSLEQIYPSRPYKYVLEVSAGFADKFGLKQGDKVKSAGY